MRVLVVSEGDHEREALQVVVKRVFGDGTETDYEKFRSKEARMLLGKGGKLYKKILAWVRHAERQAYDAVVVVVDEDGDGNRAEQSRRAREHEDLEFPKAVGLAVRMFDAWALADEAGIRVACGGTVIPKQPDPEGIANPKEHYAASIAEYFDVARSAQYARIFEHMNFGTVRQRCPIGFAPFLDDLERLVGAAGDGY